jgi:VanZ family protein
MAFPATARPIVRWLPFAVAVVAITFVSLSSSVMRWWDVQSSPETSILPGAANPVLQSRSGTGDADVHVLMWFVATLALVWAMRRHPWRRLLAAALVLWLCTGVLEIAQRWVSARTSQWIDFLGNGVGIVAGLLVGFGGLAVWRRFRGRAPHPGGAPEAEVDLDPIRPITLTASAPQSPPST